MLVILGHSSYHYCCSVAKLCLTLCDIMDCSLPAFPVLHCLLEFAQTYVHCGEGHGNPLQYSCLENPVDRGAWWRALHGVTQSRTRLKRLSTHAFIGEGNGNPLQYSCLENPRDGGAWWAAVCGVAQSQTRLKRLSSSSSSMSTETMMPSHHLILSHPLLFLPSMFPSIRVFPVSRLFASGGQSIGASASASVIPMNIQS